MASHRMEVWRVRYRVRGNHHDEYTDQWAWFSTKADATLAKAGLQMADYQPSQPERIVVQLNKLGVVGLLQDVATLVPPAFTHSKGETT